MTTSTPADNTVVKLTSTARKLHVSCLPLVRSVEDLSLIPDKHDYAKSATEEAKRDFCQPKRPAHCLSNSLTSKLLSHSSSSIEHIPDKRRRFDKRGEEYISSNSISAQSMAERKLDLTDDDVEFLIKYNQLLRKGESNDSSVLFTDEDFIKAFYKWDVESIKSSIGKSTKAQRIDIDCAYKCLKSSGVKKDIPFDLFKPLYDYYSRRWEGHQNLPVCRCSWVIIQQLNEYRSLIPSAKLA
jgi:hypothetical protein